LPRLDSLHMQLRILDAIAKNPTVGFHGLKELTGLPKATLAKYLNRLVDDGFVTVKTPVKLGRGRKSVYMLTEKGGAFLKQRRAVLSLIANIAELVNVNVNSVAPVNTTFLLSEESLQGFFISFDKKLATKLFEKLGGLETVRVYKHAGTLPEDKVKVFMRLAHVFNLAVVKAINGGGPIIYADGEAFGLPADLEKPLAEMLRSPRGVELLSLLVKAYGKLQNGNVQDFTSLFAKLDKKDIQKLENLFM
jgi:DNA-binding MarR family transcriptional regulator